MTVALASVTPCAEDIERGARCCGVTLEFDFLFPRAERSGPHRAWHVEKAGPGTEAQWFTIKAFEATDDGKRLGAMLDATVQIAAEDA